MSRECLSLERENIFACSIRSIFLLRHIAFGVPRCGVFRLPVFWYLIEFHRTQTLLLIPTVDNFQSLDGFRVRCLSWGIAEEAIVCVVNFQQLLSNILIDKDELNALTKRSSLELAWTTRLRDLIGSEKLISWKALHYSPIITRKLSVLWYSCWEEKIDGRLLAEFAMKIQVIVSAHDILI